MDTHGPPAPYSSQDVVVDHTVERDSVVWMGPGPCFRTTMVQALQSKVFQLASGAEYIPQGDCTAVCHFETGAIFTVWMLIENYSYAFVLVHNTNSASYMMLGDALVFNFKMVWPIMNLFRFRSDFY